MAADNAFSRSYGKNQRALSSGSLSYFQTSDNLFHERWYYGTTALSKTAYVTSSILHAESRLHAVTD